MWFRSSRQCSHVEGTLVTRGPVLLPFWQQLHRRREVVGLRHLAGQEQVSRFAGLDC